MLGDRARHSRSKPLAEHARTWLPGVAVLSVILGLWQGVDTIYNEPRLWMVLVSLSAIALACRRAPLALYMFWLAGLVTLGWSLGPGNTLIAFLWESLLVGAFIAGSVPAIAAVALTLASLDGYQTVAALTTYGMQSYLSGSIGYVSGAVGAAITVLGISLASIRANLVVGRLFAGLCAVIGLTLASASGSRAVYLAAVLGIASVLIRHISSRQWRSLRRTSLALAGVLVAVLALEHLGGYTVISPAWHAKATVAQTAEALAPHGILTQRLRLWEQGVETALQYPLGTGAGTYPSTTHAFQRYPMLWSSSPHNYLVQVLATGGWPRLLILLLLLAACLRVGFRNNAWPWTCAALALGVTTLFDVTGGYPRVMVLQFLLFGAGYFAGARHEQVNLNRGSLAIRLGRVARPACVLALAATIAWWYLPCTGATCAVDRYYGLEAKSLPALAAADDALREELLRRLRELYPRSLWVVQAELSYTSDAGRRLALEREVVQEFPLQHPDNYLMLARSAMDMGDAQEAVAALVAGLDVFPRDKYPYGEMRMSPERYAAWIYEAEALLRQLRHD